MNWTIVLMVAIILVTADKTITVMNIKSVEKHSPEIEDALKIERNPIARFVFRKCGLLFGAILYGIFSLGTFFIAMWLFHPAAKAYAPNNAWGVAFYIVFMFYCFVVANNIYFFLRYNKLLL